MLGVTHKQRKLTKLEETKWYLQLQEDLKQVESSNPRTAFPAEWLEKIQKVFRLFMRSLDLCVREHHHSDDLESFLRTATVDDLEQAVRQSVLSHKVENFRVRARAQLHHAQRHACMALRFLRGVLFKHIGCANEISGRISIQSLTRGVVNLRIPDSGETRRTFTDEEADKMLLSTRSPVTRLILLLLRETGLRSGAIRHLTRDALLQADDTPKPRCFVQEKGNNLRTFICSARVQAAVRECAEFWRNEASEDLWAKSTAFYMLNENNPEKPLADYTLNRLLRRVAKAAGVTGIKVHAHVWRSTLVTKLVEAGNSLESVAKFVGHHDPRTTCTFYWFPRNNTGNGNGNDEEEDGDEEASLLNPKKQDNSLFLNAANQKLEASTNMLNILLSVCGEETLARLQAKIPEYRDVIQAVNGVFEAREEEAERREELHAQPQKHRKLEAADLI